MTDYDPEAEARARLRRIDGRVDAVRAELLAADLRRAYEAGRDSTLPRCDMLIDEYEAEMAALREQLRALVDRWEAPVCPTVRAERHTVFRCCANDLRALLDPVSPPEET